MANANRIITGCAIAALACTGVCIAAKLVKRARSKPAAKVVGQVEALYIYPVKSLKGVKVGVGFAESRGFSLDRRWMVIDENNVFLSQRRLRTMALVTAKVLNANALELSAEGHGSVVAPIIAKPKEGYPSEDVVVWEKMVRGTVNQGKEVAEWLEHVLHKKNVRLVFMPDTCTRAANPKRANTNVSFADGYPYLIASTSSLEDLNKRMDDPSTNVKMNRFRPNIVISGTLPFAEDKFKSVRVGGVDMKVVKPCDRCILTTIDQETGKLGGLKAEPFKTLETFRKVGDDVLFGVNAVLENNATECAPLISVGDSVSIY